MRQKGRIKKTLDLMHDIIKRRHIYLHLVIQQIKKKKNF